MFEKENLRLECKENRQNQVLEYKNDDTKRLVCFSFYSQQLAIKLVHMTNAIWALSISFKGM